MKEKLEGKSGTRVQVSCGNHVSQTFANPTCNGVTVATTDFNKLNENSNGNFIKIRIASCLQCRFQNRFSTRLSPDSRVAHRTESRFWNRLLSILVSIPNLNRSWQFPTLVFIQLFNYLASGIVSFFADISHFVVQTKPDS